MADRPTKRITRAKATTAGASTKLKPLILDEKDELLAQYNNLQAKKEIFKREKPSDVLRNFKMTVDNQKRVSQSLHEKHTVKQPGTTRSGSVRGQFKEPTYCDSFYTNRGMDEASEPFDAKEQLYLKAQIDKFDKVTDLGLEHIKYLVLHQLIDDLRSIKDGKLESVYHNKYIELIQKGHSVTEMFQDIYSGLFTSKQLCYLNGLLATCFNTSLSDGDGKMNFKDMDYLNSVTAGEAILRIVKYTNKLDSLEETFEFMKQSAGKNLGHCVE